MKQFLAMGGYGFYVWLAYGLVFVFFTTVLLRCKLQLRKLSRKPVKLAAELDYAPKT